MGDIDDDLYRVSDDCTNRSTTVAETEGQLRLDEICRALGVGDLLPNSSMAASDLIFNLRAIANCDTDPQLRLDTICQDVENGVLDLTKPELASDLGYSLARSC